MSMMIPICAAGRPRKYDQKVICESKSMTPPKNSATAMRVESMALVCCIFIFYLILSY